MQWMRDERRPLRRPRWDRCSISAWTHVVVRGVNIRCQHTLGAAPSHARRTDKLAYAAMAGCIIVAGGSSDCGGGLDGGVARTSAEVYDEVLGRWLRLPRDLPHISRMGMSGALL